MIRRVVFDTSTLVSAALRNGSVPYQALAKAVAACELCACVETLAELERVLERRKFDRYLDRSSRLEFVALIRRHATLFALQPGDLKAVSPGCRDPKDNQFLALAKVSDAEGIVSSDEDLLILHPWQKVPILRPQAFLDHLRTK